MFVLRNGEWLSFSSSCAVFAVSLIFLPPPSFVLYAPLHDVPTPILPVCTCLRCPAFHASHSRPHQGHRGSGLIVICRDTPELTETPKPPSWQANLRLWRPRSTHRDTTGPALSRSPTLPQGLLGTHFQGRGHPHSPNQPRISLPACCTARV